MSPETYLGSLRADGWVEPVRNGTTAFDAPAADSLDLNEILAPSRMSSVTS